MPDSIFQQPNWETKDVVMSLDVQFDGHVFLSFLFLWWQTQNSSLHFYMSIWRNQTSSKHHWTEHFFVLLFWILWKTPMQATHFSCLSVSLFAGRTITHTIWWCCCCCCLLFAFVSWVVLICVDFLFDCSFFAPAAALPANVRKCHNNRARLSEETKKKRKKRQERAQFCLGVRRTFFGMAPEQR